METDYTNALARLIQMQNNADETSLSSSLNILLEQHALKINYEEQKALVISFDYILDSSNLQELKPELVSRIISQVCMPQAMSVLKSIRELEGEYTADALSECATSILEKCLPVCASDEPMTALLTAAVSVLSAVFVSSSGGTEAWSGGLRCACRLTAAAVSAMSDETLRPHLAPLAAVLAGLMSSGRPAAALAGVAALGPLLLARREFATEHAADLWTLLRPADDDADLSRCLAAVCALADHLLSPLAPPPELLWPLIGRGLTAADPLQRKRARYLLQRAVETRRSAGVDHPCRWLPWSRAAAKRAAPLWDDLALLLETLEGKQVHLIRPVMGKLDALLAGTEMVPLSWSLCVLRRAFGHGNGFVVRWGVLRALDLRAVAADDVPATAEDDDEDELETFVTSALVPALNESSLYTDVDLHAVLSFWEPPASGERYECDAMAPPTEVGLRLRAFLTEYLTPGPVVGWRAASLTAAVASQSWSSVALLHVAHALAAVPAGRCLQAPAALTLCRSLSERLAAQETVLRRASRRLLLRVVLGWLREDELALECAVAAAAAAEGGEPPAPVGLAAPEPAALATEVTAALAAERGPARGRLLGLALRLLSAGLPLTIDHPALPLLRSALIECHTDVYRPRASVISDIALLTALVGPDSGSDSVPAAVRSLIGDITPSVGEFILRQTESATAAEDLTLCKFYAEFLRAAAAAGCCHELETVVRRLCDAAGAERPLQVHAAVVIVSALLQDSALVPTTAGALLTLAERAREGSVPAALSTCPGAGACDTPLAARHVACTWRLMEALLRASSMPEEARRRAAPAAVAALSVCPRRGLVPLINSLPALLTGAAPELLREASAAAWGALHEHRRSEVFVLALPALTRLVFTAETLSTPALSDLVRDMSDKLLKLAESVPAALFALIRQLLSVWSTDASSLPHHLQTVAAALLHGAVHRRDRRALQETVGFVSGPAAPPTSDHLLERSVRAAGVAALRLLSRVGPGTAAAELAAELSRQADRAGDGRHFGNSASHRLQQRAYQALLVLHTALSEEEWAGLCSSTCDRLLRCHPQPSVRYMQEWLVVLLCMQHPPLTDVVWQHLDKAGEGRTGSIGSFVAILTHLAQAHASPAAAAPAAAAAAAPAASAATAATSAVHAAASAASAAAFAAPAAEAEQFVSRCFRRVLPWCMAQHFNTRVYAQAALHRLWLLAEARGMSSVLSDYRVVHDSVAQSLEHGNAAKNSQLILGDFYFTVFNPVRHFTLEAIYSAVPRLASVEQDEWIPTELFDEGIAEDVANRGEGERLPLGLHCPELRGARPASWMPRTADMRSEPAAAAGGQGDGAADMDACAAGGEVQRKPTPWRQLLPDPSELAAAGRGRRVGDTASGPVLVASLVDKPPNLGGLCRTCEVLGAVEMALPSLQILADKQFQSLSVSAERWVPLTEVRPHQVADYLHRLRSAGYTLVGVEQTSNSVPVTEYHFPEKTALLLGNEREGVPVELIQLLDVCLEIPQCGLVRSLNVHVAGALLLWEYRRQHPAQAQ